MFPRLRKVGSRNISVAGLKHRTTNPIERLHRDINEYITASNNLFTWLEKMEASIHNEAITLADKLERGIPDSSKLYKISAAAQENLKKRIKRDQEYRKGNIKPMEYLESYALVNVNNEGIIIDENTQVELDQINEQSEDLEDWIFTTQSWQALEKNLCKRVSF